MKASDGFKGVFKVSCLCISHTRFMSMYFLRENPLFVERYCKPPNVPRKVLNVSPPRSSVISSHSSHAGNVIFSSIFFGEKLKLELAMNNCFVTNKCIQVLFNETFKGYIFHHILSYKNKI